MRGPSEAAAQVLQGPIRQAPHGVLGSIQIGGDGPERIPGKEVALRQQMTVPLHRVVLDKPIPTGARFALTAQVWYYDSDAQGRAIGTDGGRHGRVTGTFFHAIARRESE